VTGVAERLTLVRARIARAAERARRDPASITLIGVTKGVEPARIEAAIAAGLHELGENRVQEALPKIAALPAGVRWHLVGHLQRNKARAAAGAFAVIHSVDRLRLAEVLDRAAGELGRRLPVLVEVNVAGEATKFGCAPAEVEALIAGLGTCQHLVPVGLMTVAPLVHDPEAVRPVFRRLRELRDRLWGHPGAAGSGELSMGMSGDFEVAIEEGATMVRIGRAIFGERTPAGHGRGRGQDQGGGREQEV
jgi:hypothetical protein